MNPHMDQYVSVVPRLLPSQHSAKRIPIIDDGYQYVDTHPTPPYMNPQTNINNPLPLSSRVDLTQSQDNLLNPNQSFYINNNNPIDKSFNARTNKGRFHHEALKDNSFDQYPPINSYPTNYDYRSFDNNSKENPTQDSINKSTKIIIIIFGIIVALFSLTALAISIYLLIRISSSSSG